MRIVIIGATSSIARHCARQWVAREKCICILVGRDKKRLQAVGQDLEVVNPLTHTQIQVLDFQDPTAIEAFAKTVFDKGPIDLLLVAHGLLGDQQRCQQDLAFCREVLMVNAVSPVMFLEAFAKRMHQGKIVMMGSVAGDMGRRANYTYGATKGLLERYAQGLQHRFLGSLVQVVLIKAGPTRTPMTRHLALPPYLFSAVDTVSKAVVKAIDKNKAGSFYVPKKWRWIMGILCLLPRVILRHLSA